MNVVDFLNQGIPHAGTEYDKSTVASKDTFLKELWEAEDLFSETSSPVKGGHVEDLNLSSSSWSAASDQFSDSSFCHCSSHQSSTASTRYEPPPPEHPPIKHSSESHKQLLQAKQKHLAERARLLKENTELHELIHRLEAKVEVLGAMKTEYVAQQGKVSDADARIRQLEEETRRLEKENSSLASALADEKDTTKYLRKQCMLKDQLLQKERESKAHSSFELEEKTRECLHLRERVKTLQTAKDALLRQVKHLKSATEDMEQRVSAWTMSKCLGDFGYRKTNSDRAAQPQAREVDERPHRPVSSPRSLHATSEPQQVAASSTKSDSTSKSSLVSQTRPASVTSEGVPAATSKRNPKPRSLSARSRGRSAQKREQIKQSSPPPPVRGTAKSKASAEEIRKRLTNLKKSRVSASKAGSSSDVTQTPRLKSSTANDTTAKASKPNKSRSCSASACEDGCCPAEMELRKLRLQYISWKNSHQTEAEQNLSR